MFSWIGSQIETVLSTYVLDVVGALIRTVEPIVLTVMTLWITLYGWAVIRGETSQTLPLFLWKIFKISLILCFSLQSGFYLSSISETASSLATGVASTFLPVVVNRAAITSPYAILDVFNDKAGQLVVDLLKEASVLRLDLILAAVMTAFGNVIFLCISLYVVTLSKLYLTFVIAVGPIFLLSLAWRPTARFFDSWLSMVLNSIVLTWFSFFALGLSAYIGDTLVQVIQDQGGFSGSTFNVVGESLKYCVVMILMAIICFQAPSLASALTGGAAVQQGINMIQNTLMVSGLRSASSSRSVGHASTGRSASSDAGIPYTAGHATGFGLAAAGRLAGHSAASAGGTVRYGYAAVRMAAYKLAALRGRS